MTEDANEGHDPGDARQRQHRVPKPSHVVTALVALGAIWLVTQTAELSLQVALVAGVALAVVPRKLTIALGAIVVVLAGMWVGANSPRHTWFGSQVSNGPRDGNEVAITFDDGPNDPATLAIAHILDAHHAKGTFFIVGKALDERPDIVKALLDGGHLVGNHSYSHDSTAWLDPRYPELTRTQRAFDAQVGVCPAFYRAPHGQHTPFLAYDVHANGMTMIGWDVSVGDWLAKDPKALAARILRKVKPGSIIDLHDSLDGDVHSDRHVLVEAMPFLLDGLEARGLEPVRLDHLLGRDGYLDC